MAISRKSNNALYPHSKKEMMDLKQATNNPEVQEMTREDRMRLFVEIYMETGNQTQSYLDAGYKGTPQNAGGNASRLARHPFVVAEIERRTRQMAGQMALYSQLSQEDKEMLVAEPDEIKTMLTAIMRDPNANANSRIDAAKELAKLQGLYREEKAVPTPDDLRKELEDTLGLHDPDEE